MVIEPVFIIISCRIFYLLDAFSPCNACSLQLATVTVNCIHSFDGHTGYSYGTGS